MTIINRVESKYIVPFQYLNALITDLGPFVYSDPHYPKNSKYTVRSVYLDTPDFSFHKMRLARHPNGLRIRLRSYSTDKKCSEILKCQLDIKAKRARSFKEIKPISAEFYHLLTKNVFVDQSNVSNQYDLEVFQQIRALGVTPVSVVEYDRNGYFNLHDQSIRVTLDSNIYCSKPTGIIKFPMFKNYSCLLEIKNSNGEAWPFWIKNLIEKYNLEKINFSKQKWAMNLLYEFN